MVCPLPSDAKIVDDIEKQVSKELEYLCYPACSVNRAMVKENDR